MLSNQIDPLCLLQSAYITMRSNKIIEKVNVTLHLDDTPLQVPAKMAPCTASPSLHSYNGSHGIIIIQKVEFEFEHCGDYIR
jgi:hypothetical protein